MAYLARRRILQEEGADIARRAAEAGGLPWETVGGPSASSTEPSVPEPEPTPRVAPIEPPATPKQMPPEVKAIVERQEEAKAKEEEERRAAEAAAVDEATQPRHGAIPVRCVDFANQDVSQVPPWRISGLLQARRILAEVSGVSQKEDTASTEHTTTRRRRWSVPRAEASSRAATEAVPSGELLVLHNSASPTPTTGVITHVQ